MTRKARSWGIMTLTILALTSFSWQPALPAEDDETELPRDTCVLEINLQEGATIAIDGRDYGAKRTFTYTPLDADQFYPVPLEVRFADGSTASRRLLIEGGRKIRLDMRGPTGPLPEMVVQKGHSAWVQDAVFSPDGKHVLTGDSDGTTVLWDTESGRLLREYGTTHGVNAVAFSPDGKLIVTGGGLQTDAELFLWDVTSGQLVRRLDAVWKIRSAAFSPDGKLLLTSGADYKEGKTTYEIDLWNVATGRRLRSVSGHKEGSVVYCVAFSPDGRFFATAADDGNVILWKTATGTIERKITKAWPGIRALAFNPDGQHIAFGYDSQVFVWNWQIDEEVRAIDLRQKSTQFVSDIAFSPVGDQLLTVTYDVNRTSDVALWTWRTGKKQRRFVGHSLHVLCATFSPNGECVLTGSEDRSAVRWNTATGERLQSYTGHARRIGEILAIPGAQRLFLGTHYSTQSAVYNSKTGEKLETSDFMRGQPNLPYVVHRALRNDGRRLFAGHGIRGKDDQAIYLTVPGNEKLHTFPHENTIDCVAISPDGRTLLTGFGIWNIDKSQHDARAFLWDADTGVKVQSLDPGQKGVIGSAAFTPDSHLVAIGNGRDDDGTISLWDVTTGTRIRTFSGHQARVNSMTFSADGQRLLSAGGSLYAPDAVLLWDVATGQRIRRFSLDSAPEMEDVRFSPDGRLALAAGGKTAAVWDLGSGRLLRIFHGHSGRVYVALFHPDSRRILTGSADGTARFWDIATGEELARLVSLDAAEDWLVVAPNGLFDGSTTGRQRVSYRVGDGLNVVPVDRFFQDFYRPGLLAEVLGGKRPVPSVHFADKAAPKVRITSDIQSGTVTTPKVTFQVEVTDQGGGVKGPWLAHNGAKVLVPGEPTRKGKVVERTFTVALVEGENRLEILAASEDGSWESEPATLILQYEESVAKPSFYLIAVGISRYAEDTMQLKFAAVDAKAIADVFAKRGTQLYGNGRVHVFQILDEKATKTGIRSALDDVARKATPQDTVMLFLAGHGTMVGQRYYFIPHEFQNQSATLEDDIRQQGLAGDDLDDSLRTIPALKRLVIYDTCHSGGTIHVSRTARDPFAFRGALERMSRATGSFTIAATAAGDEAQEVPELGHGVLTYALLAGLGAVDVGPLKQQAIKPKEGKVVEVRDWFSYAQDKVPVLTKYHFGREQFVAFSGHGQSFPVLPME